MEGFSFFVMSYFHRINAGKKYFVRLTRSLTIFLCLAATLVSTAIAADPFTPPKPLEPRVQFWVDIFAKYSTADFLVHHRMFPQAVFMEVVLEPYSKNMGPIAFDVMKKKHEKLAVQQVKEAVTRLASGHQPSSALERRIVSEMAFLPGGRERFQAMLRDDLIRTQTGIREKTEGALQRGALYLPIIQQVFAKEYGLPTQLTLLPIIESSFDYEAYSSVGAAGIWQLMPATARQYGLKVNSIVDERRDVVEATRAAAKYFTDAYRSLESWPLAITSYNHGIAGVRRKVNQMGTRDISRIIEHPSVRLFGFASNNFYPEFLAALHIYNNQKLFFPDLNVPESVYMTQVTLPRAYSLAQLANNLGLDKNVLHSYNYGLLNPVLKGVQPVPSGYKLKVPHTHAEKVKMIKTLEPARSTIAASAPTVDRPKVTGYTSVSAHQQYQVRSGDTLSSISRKFGVKVSDLVAANGIRGSVIKVGQKLRVPIKTGATTVQAAPRPSAPTSAARYHVVRSGDTLWSIAKRYGVSVSTLKALNPSAAKVIKSGQKLRVS